MVLQCLSDCTVTIRKPPSYYVLGNGELLTLPLCLALEVLNEASGNFKIVQPTPLLPGVAVRWLAPDDSAQGPGLVQLVDGNRPDRRISVSVSGELRWIHERDIIEVDPWPALDSWLEEVYVPYLIDGAKSSKMIEFANWLSTHFDEDRDPWMR